MHANTCAAIRATISALTSLNLSNNDLEPEGAKHVAEAIKGHVRVL